VKPINLTISGLHSFRKLQTIDFTQVTDTGIFGIFGPTGSGKSTILDAITLALYGEVERSESNRTGILNQQENKIYVKFTFELHSGAHYVRYSVERSYSKNKEQKIRTSLARLIRFENGIEVPVADQEKEVTRSIQNILGLEFKDFKRAVVLPQGKFAEFLTLKSDQRRPMLERIFHLDEYGKQLKERAVKYEGNLKNQINEIIIKQEGLSHATKENVEQLENEVVQLQQLLLEKKDEYQQYLREYQEFQHLWNTQQEFLQIKEDLRTLLEKESYIKELMKKKENAEKALFIEPTYRQFESLEVQLIHLRSSIEESFRLLTVAKQQQEQNKIIYDKKQSNFDIEITQLNEMKFQLSQAFQWEKEILDLNNQMKQLQNSHQEKNAQLLNQLQQHKSIQELSVALKQKRLEVSEQLSQFLITPEHRKRIEQAWEITAKIETVERQMSQRRLEINEKEKKVIEINEQQNEQQQTHDFIGQEIVILDIQLKELDFKKPITEDKWILQDRKILQNELTIKQLGQFSMDISKIEMEISNYRDKLDKAKYSLKVLNEKLSVEEEHLDLARIEKENMEQFQQQKIARQLAKYLEEGKPCLVCGSIHHPNPQLLSSEVIEDTGESSLFEERINEIIGSITIKKREQIILEQQLEHLNVQMVLNNTELENRKRTMRELLLQLPIHYHNLSMDQIKENYEKELDYHFEIKKLLDHWKSTRNELHEKLQKLSEDELKTQNQIDILQSQLTIYQNQIKQIYEEILHLEQEWTLLSEKWNQMENDFSRDEIDSIRQKIQQCDHKRNKLEKQYHELDGQWQETVLKEKTWQDSINQLQFVIEQENQTLQLQSKKLDEVNNKYIMITKGRTAQELEEELDRNYQESKNELGKIKQTWEVSVERTKELDKKVGSEEAVYNNVMEQFEQINQQLLSFLDVNNWSSIGEYKSCILSAEKIEEFSEEIKEYEKNKQLLFEKEKSCLFILKGREIKNEEWEQINSTKKSKEEEINQIQQDLTKGNFQYEQLKKDYSSWNQLEGKRKIIQDELDVASELSQVLRGNSFIDFIAQEYLQNITILASEKLLQLTRNRFRIEVDIEGTFEIIDDFNGGLKRPVRSLSGGETFLTSLALALALSSQLQLKGGVPLEFFFLDEGFGTLDSDLLDTVMMTLEKVHSEHMVIGIISHVPELKNRLHRKIIIISADDRGNGSTVQIEL